MARRGVRDAVAETVEARALEAEDDLAAAIAEARAALGVVRMLDALDASRADGELGALDAAAVAQLYDDLCDAVRDEDVRVVERVAAAVGDEFAARGERAAAGRDAVASADAAGSAGILLHDDASRWMWGEDAPPKLRHRRARAGGVARAVERVVRPGRRFTTHERAMCWSAIVWAFAVAALGVAWMRSTVIFVNAQRRPVVQNVFVEKQELELPALTICPTDSHRLPTFHDFPRPQFLGSPWLTLRLYHENARIADGSGNVVAFPDTKSLIQTTIVADGDVAACERDTDVLNPFVHISRESPPPNEPPAAFLACRRCITIGRDKPIVVKGFTAQTSGQVGGLQVELVTSRAPYFCLYPQARASNFIVFDALIFEIFDKLDELIDRGILNLNNADRDATQQGLGNIIYPSILFYDSGPSPEGGEPPPVRPVDFDGPSSFYCGVYLFSGLWYPTTTEKVSWTYNKSGTGWWERDIGSGLGPYFDTSVYQESLEAVAPSRKPRSDPVIYKGLPDFDVYLTDSEEPLNANLNSSTRAATLGSNTITFLRLSKETDLDRRIQYNPTLTSTARLVKVKHTEEEVRLAFIRYQMDISFTSLVVSEIVTRPSYNFPAYLADLSNYFGIFIGHSVFTLLILLLTRVATGWRAEFVQSSASSL